MKFKEGDIIECIIPYGNISKGDKFRIRTFGTIRVEVEAINPILGWIGRNGGLNRSFVETNYRLLPRQLELEF